MSEHTPEQEKADAELEQAINNCLLAYSDKLPSTAGNAMLIDFVVAVETLKFGEEGREDIEAVSVLFKHGQMRRTVAIGILSEALSLFDPDED